ncbi:T9SS type A sorting domain-containing protein [Flavobacteriaceae bacterium]|nr:T9SS type A sorting domain-containing protein [Flavobacteriaceae bacterium]
MKKNYFLTLILAFTVVFVSSAQVTELFISKYAEGSSNNKFLEIYNGTDATISLSDYAFPTVSNAPTTPGEYEYWNTFPEGAEIAPGGVYVIAHGSANASILAEADQTYQYLSNGDDGLALVGGVTYDAAGEVAGYTILDWLGDWQADPGSGWEVAGVSAATKDHTLTRKSTVCGPNNDWAASAGTNAADSEWIVGNIDTGWDTLGSFSGCVSDPTISLGGTIASLDYYENNGPSSEGDFSVSGSNLTNDITVSVSSNFEISLASGSGFASTVTVSQTAGTAEATTIYVRLSSGLSPETYDGVVTASSNGATDSTLSISGIVSPENPEFTVTANLDDFNYIASTGGPSPEDSFSVEGLFLQDDISITAPTNFEVSLTTAIGFGSSVTITPDQSGTVASTDVFVRLAGSLSAGNYTGDITISSTGVADELITVNGNSFAANTNSLVITGVFDAPLTGGTPKGIELYVINDIDDLSSFGVGSANNGGGTDGQEFTFPADAASAGTYIYVASDVDQFTAFFGFTPTYNAGSVMSINGDDAIELFENGSVSDTFGTVDCDPNASNTTCPEWEHTDGWAYRNDDTGPEGTTFTSTNWTYSGVDALDGASDNASATTPFPIGTYSNTTASTSNNTITGFNAYPNPVKGNSLTVTTSSTEVKTVNIFNVLGRKVFSQRFSSMNKTMDISGISSGVYIMKVSEGNNIATKKLIIE